MGNNVFLTQASGGAIILMETGVLDFGTVARGAKVGADQNLDSMEAPNFRWRSKPYTPLGESGLAVFRRAYLSVRHNAGFTLTVVPYVDGEELLMKDGSTSQATSFTVIAPPDGGTVIEYLEVPMNGEGTALQLIVQTAAVSGEFSLEGLTIGFLPVREMLLGDTG